MKELSLNILDVAENSVKAGASLTEVLINEDENSLSITIKDDGCGMDEETVKSVTDPFYTTRTTRSVGLGIPLLKLAAEQCEGTLTVISSTEKDAHGTTVTATFNKKHIDFTPLGDVISSITTLIQGHPDTDFHFCHTKESGKVELDTREMRDMLGGIPLNTYEVIKWTEDYLKEQYEVL